VVLYLRVILTAFCDFFLLCSGDSWAQVVGISSSVQRYTRQQLSEMPCIVEGKSNSEWVLMDYVSVVAHVFYKETRAFYELEDLWADAVRTDILNID